MKMGIISMQNLSSQSLARSASTGCDVHVPRLNKRPESITFCRLWSIRPATPTAARVKWKQNFSLSVFFSFALYLFFTYFQHFFLLFSVFFFTLGIFFFYSGFFFFIFSLFFSFTSIFCPFYCKICFNAIDFRGKKSNTIIPMAILIHATMVKKTKSQ